MPRDEKRRMLYFTREEKGEDEVEVDELNLIFSSIVQFIRAFLASGFGSGHHPC